MVNAIQGLLATEDGTPLIPYVNPASEEEFGVVKVDNDTIKIDENGVITGTNVLIAGDNIEIENNVISAKNGAMPIGAVFPLNCTSNYVPEGCLPCDGAEYSKAQFKQLWDNYLTGEVTWNYYYTDLIGYDSLGEPIVENQYMSFHSSGRHITVDSEYTWNFCFKLNDITTSQQLCSIYDMNTSSWLNVNINNGSLQYTLSGTTTTIISIGGELSLKFENDTLYYSTGDTWNEIVTKSFGASTIGSNDIDGSIDLSKSYINDIQLATYSSNALLNICTYEEYEQDLATYGQCSKFAVKPLEYDGSQLTIVGSPTITDDGIMSNFSSNDYVSLLPVSTIHSSNFKISMSFKPFSLSQGVLISSRVSGTAEFGLTLLVNNSKLLLFASSDGQTWNIANTKEGKTKLSANVEYLVDVLFTGNQYVVALTNKETNVKTIEILIDSSELIYNGSNFLHLGYGGWTPFSGEIDLKQFSITSDGQTVFSGGVGDTFKVPTIKDGAVVQQAMSDGELGKSYNAGLPNIYATFRYREMSGDPTQIIDQATGAFSTSPQTEASLTQITSGSSSYASSKLILDASTYNSIYGNSNTVQMNAVALRYFVVVANGQLEESAMNWSEWASSLQGKANADLSNCTKPYIIETSDKSLMPSWYRVYSDGWCEQGSKVSGENNLTVTLLQPYLDTGYNIFCQNSTTTTNTTICTSKCINKTTTGFVLVKSNANDFTFEWQASGYIS